MNVFKSLDNIFPTGTERRFGEVVGVCVRVFCDNVDLGEVSGKRKAWYVNASVNAFHLHRSLVRDFTEQIRGLELSSRQIRRAKRLICLATLEGYVQNALADTQYTNYYLSIETGNVALRMKGRDVRLSRDVGDGSFRDVSDNVSVDLKGIIDTAVVYVEITRGERCHEVGPSVKEGD